MKKKVIALILYFALLLSSVFPATALAEGEPDAGSLPAEQAEAGGQQGGGDTPEPASTETPACTCTVKCSEGAVYSNCPVCSAAADLSACQGAEPQPANEQGDGDTPEPASTDTPVCTCTTKCAEGAVNADCSVCASDWSSCAFTGESGDLEPDKGTESVTVTEWSWVDEKAVLAHDGKLYLPSAVTAESLEGIKALLPQYIQAGEEKLALAWTYEESTGIFTATLPKGYALAEAVKPLTVETVNMGADTLEEKEVKYIDASGTEQTVKATIVTSDGDEVGSISGGWYAVVDGSVTIEGRVNIRGNINLILADGCTLTVTDGIEVDEGYSLSIYAQKNGTGALFAAGHTDGTAGIGGSNSYNGGNVNCGSINIYGGNITATGGSGAAGIGGGPGGSGGTVNIYGGTVTATGGGVDAITDQSGKGRWRGVVFENGLGRVYGDKTIGGSLTIAEGQTLEVPAGETLNISGSVTCNGIIDNAGTLNVESTGIIQGSGYLRNTGTINKADGGTIDIKIKKPVKYMDEYGKEQTVDAIIVTADDTEWTAPNNGETWYVAESNVTIGQKLIILGGNKSYVNLILADSCTLTIKGGIKGGDSAFLNIYCQSGGSGKLVADARGEENASGLDCNATVSIYGGTVEAYAGSGNGSGIRPYAVIFGGTVYAQGSGTGSGIGGAAANETGGATIFGGDVTAVGGSKGGAGIGGGDDESPYGSKIEIFGGTVKATGRGGGAGLGGVLNSEGGRITISGGDVTAIAEDGGVGIGYGLDPSSGPGEAILISGGTVHASGAYSIGVWSDTLNSYIETGASGNALIYLDGPINNNDSRDDPAGWSCIIFDEQNETAKVYGGPTITGSLSIGENWTLTVPQEAVLFTAATGSIDCSGTIENLGSIQNHGSIKGSGVLKNQGRLLNQGTITLKIEGDTETDKKTVSYMDENGIERQVEATLVTPIDWRLGTDGQTSWYVVEDKLTIDDMLWICGDVNLILADGCSLTVTKGIIVANNPYGDDIPSFIVYAQKGGSGSLKAIGSGQGGAGIGGLQGATVGDITIRGGIIEAIGGSGDGVIGGGAGIGAGGGGQSGSVTISGGTVIATGGYGSYSGAGIGAGGLGNPSGWEISVTISGGTVIATGGSKGAGIGGSGSTFSTGTGGTAIIYATGDSGAAAISDQSGKTAGTWSGIIFENGVGAVYGNQSNSGSFTIATGQSLEILSGSSFTNNGTLTIDGDLTNNGSFTNNGPVTVPMKGTFTNKVTLNCNYHSFDDTGLCVLRCGGIAVSGISLDKAELKLKPGGTAALRATVSPDNASNKDLTWSSSDSGIATVDENGTVTAHKAGKATITATAADGSGKTATCTVTVLVPVSSVTLSRSSLRIYEGRGYSLSAAVSPADAADKNLIWSSSDPSIATVDQKGNVIGKAPGVCTIYATAADGSGAFASCTVRVLRWFPGATPITGDSSNLGVWIGLLGASLVAVGAAAFILIKKRKKK